MPSRDAKKEQLVPLSFESSATIGLLILPPQIAISVSTQVRYVAELLESLEEELGSKFDGGTESQSTHELHRQSW